jgi:hypothetical protein
MILFKPIDAIAVITECLRSGKRVHGIDAFVIEEPCIQPYMEFSMDASNNHCPEDQAMIFVQHLNTHLESDLIFEVVFEGCSCYS